MSVEIGQLYVDASYHPSVVGFVAEVFGGAFKNVARLELWADGVLIQSSLHRVEYLSPVGPRDSA